MQEGTSAWHRAWDVLALTNPLPATMGHVCYAGCEQSCLRGDLDQGLAIRSLELSLGMAAIRHHWELPVAGPQTGVTVLVIGSGPAGLGAAALLRRYGHDVVLRESRPVTGGMLRYAIPPSRLPRDGLDAEIARIVDAGVDLQRGSTVMDPMKQLSSFDAVIHCAGAANVLAIVEGAVLWNQATHRGTLQRRRNVTLALGNGVQAADAVNAHFGGRPRPGRGSGTIDLTSMNTWYYPRAPRTLPRATAGATHREPGGAPDPAAVTFEARRCLSCGACLGCDNCYGMCPDDAVIKLDAPCSYEFDLDYCKGCGICAAECPPGAIRMISEAR
jgi:Pyruvate/2-oxoacid:ferredoxin oxidoreductase delta subunit